MRHSCTTHWGVDNGANGGPWLRHPADAVLPSTGEYADYIEYDPLVPIGRPEDTLSGFTMDEVRPGEDKVICISCHRAHGSPYPDMLRWNYNTMKVGGGGSGGCFNCHSAKSD
jgi:predicted CXXCH cytochrome family protein